VKKLEGDYDVFGDGRVTIISTPGHTPGQSACRRLCYRNENVTELSEGRLPIQPTATPSILTTAKHDTLHKIKIAKAARKDETAKPFSAGLPSATSAINLPSYYARNFF
jgi:hypothetical protein